MSAYVAHAVARSAARSTWWPTRKWWAATIIAFGGFLGTLAMHSWSCTPEFAGAVITIGTQRLVAYLVLNDSAPAAEPAP